MTKSFKTSGNPSASAGDRVGLVFDAMHPVTANSDARQYADVDDQALTAFVTTLWEDLYSKEARPAPSCPHCGRPSRPHSRPNRFHALPIFRCATCRRTFSRLTGSPLARLRFAEKMPAFIRLLSQPIPLEEVSRRLEVEYGAASNWLMRFRELIAQHDAEGVWLNRVRLGVKYRPHGTCPHCGYIGVLLNGGYDLDDRRRALCPECRAYWTLDATGPGGEVEVRIVEDLALNAVARRRRNGKDAPDLPSVQRAIIRTPDRIKPTPVAPPSLPVPDSARFDFTQPLRANSPLPRRHAEDRDLTRFLEAAVRAVLSADEAPLPRCPRCASEQTRFVGRRQAEYALPLFHCSACSRSFTRVTGTPMANMLRRDMLFAFLPWLSQHRPLTQVAEVFATSPEIIKAKIRRFRQWLLVLDPTGRYEQRVRLGLKVPWPSMACPKCNEHAPARPHGFRRARGGRLVVPRERLFRCTGCHGFFGLPVDEISVHIGEDGRGG